MSEKMVSNQANEIEKEESIQGIIKWFTHNHVAANMLMLFLIIGGMISLSTMIVETFPQTDPRMITISVSYPGAAPHDVSKSISKRAEEALIGIEGVKKITSKSSEGGALIKVKLEDFANSDYVYDEIETIINSLDNFPPDNAAKPVIAKSRITSDVITIALYGNVDEAALKYWTETIEDEIRQLPDVSITNVRGVRNSQISIEVPEFTLRRYGLTLADIDQAVKNYSKDIAAGSMELKQEEVLLRVQDKKYTGFDLERIIIKTLPNGAVLRIGDIAEVIDGFDNSNLISKFNGKPASFIDVKRSDSDNTLKIDKSIKEYLNSVTLPNGLYMSIANDETIILKDRISLMVRNGVLGFMLVFLILLLFLDLKLAFWTSLAIPVSFLGGLMIMHQIGYSINMITLFALIIVLGIVVDDGIVTGESIFEAQSRDKSPSGVIKGVKAVLAPVTVGVLTTMAAFVPLIFSSGTLGQIVGVIPVVVISILFISLIDAYFILPAHLSNPTLWSRGIIADIRDIVTQKLELFLDSFFMPFTEKAVLNKYKTLLIFIFILFATFIIVKIGLIRFVFFPQIESDRITIEASMPKGTPFSVTRDTIFKIEQAAISVRDEIDQDNDISVFKNMIVSVGSLSSGDSPFKQSKKSLANHLGEIRIHLVPSDFRKYSASQIENMIRNKVGNLPEAESIVYKSSLISKNSDIELELSHPDEELLYSISQELENEIAKIPGTREIIDDSQDGKNEFIFKINERGNAVGLTPAYLGRQLRAAYFGLESQTLQRGSLEVEVYVRYPKSERESISALENMVIMTPDGRELPLSSVATIVQQVGYSQIKSVDGKQVISVTANVNLEHNTPNNVIELLGSQVLPKLKAKYPRLKYSFEGERREQKEDLSGLQRNMIIALLLIYVILGAQLRSYLQPLVIMCSIPFGIVGAILGHLLLGHDMTFISMFGIVALTGVVINDSVVLIDYLNNQYLSGKTIYESAISAVRRRFRPILLTTLSTSLGLLPMLLETSMQAQFLIPMVISLSTGIVFATAIILLLVPCLILALHDLKQCLNIQTTNVK